MSLDLKMSDLLNKPENLLVFIVAQIDSMKLAIDANKEGIDKLTEVVNKLAAGDNVSKEEVVKILKDIDAFKTFKDKEEIFSKASYDDINKLKKQVEDLNTFKTQITTKNELIKDNAARSYAIIGIIISVVGLLYTIFSAISSQ